MSAAETGPGRHAGGAAAAERAGARAAVRAAGRVAEAIRAAAPPGVRIEQEGAMVTVTGRGLDEVAALRWPAGLLR